MMKLYIYSWFPFTRKVRRNESHPGDWSSSNINLENVPVITCEDDIQCNQLNHFCQMHRGLGTPCKGILSCLVHRFNNHCDQLSRALRADCIGSPHRQLPQLKIHQIKFIWYTRVELFVYDLACVAGVLRGRKEERRAHEAQEDWTREDSGTGRLQGCYCFLYSAL